MNLLTPLCHRLQSCVRVSDHEPMHTAQPACMCAFVFVCASLCWLLQPLRGYRQHVTPVPESRVLRTDSLQSPAVDSNTVGTWRGVGQCCCEDVTEHILFLILLTYSYSETPLTFWEKNPHLSCCAFLATYVCSSLHACFSCTLHLSHTAEVSYTGFPPLLSH